MMPNYRVFYFLTLLVSATSCAARVSDDNTKTCSDDGDCNGLQCIGSVCRERAPSTTNAGDVPAPSVNGSGAANSLPSLDGKGGVDASAPMLDGPIDGIGGSSGDGGMAGTNASSLDPMEDAGPRDSGIGGEGGETNSCAMDASGAVDANCACVDDTTPPEPLPLWNDDSVTVAVDLKGFWAIMRYEQERSHLTATQLELLSAMRYQWFFPCVEQADSDFLEFTVTDADGTTRTGTSTGSWHEPLWVLAAEPVRAFMQTLSCRSEEVYGSIALPESPDGTVVLAPDDGCYHVFAGAGWFVANIESPGGYRFSLDDEGDELSTIAIYSDSSPPDAGVADAGAGPITEAPPTDGQCPEVTVNLEAPGRYPIYVVGGTHTYLRASSL